MLWKSICIGAFSITAFSSLYGQTPDTKQTSPPKPPAAESVSTEIEYIEGKVIIVTDGDAIRVKSAEGKVYAVRLHGIDAPEPGQAFGVKSRKKLEDQIINKEVKVIVHRQDSQGRYIGTVFLHGQDIGVRMLENGNAWHYKRVSGEQSSDVRARYARAELKAREAKAGLWTDAMPIPPWEFREEIDTDSLTSAQKAEAAKRPANPQSVVQTATKQEAKNGRAYILGPRGGCYYVNSEGAKVYVRDKSLCNKP